MFDGQRQVVLRDSRRGAGSWRLRPFLHQCFRMVTAPVAAASGHEVAWRDVEEYLCRSPGNPDGRV